MISEKYTGSKTKVTVECKICAEENKPILHEKWVKEKNEKMYNRIKLYIENKGGTIISTEYIGVKTNIMFECAKKHKC